MSDVSDYPTMTAWVVSASPLTIKTAGAATAISAVKVDGITVTANDRVTIAIRTPRIPLITTVEEAI